jgi:hypothetical protein
MTELISLQGHPNFWMKLVDPRSFAYKDALECSDVLLTSFKDSPLLQFWHGPDYRFESDLVEIKERLRNGQLDERVQRYKRLLHSNARHLQLMTLDKRVVFCCLYRITEDQDQRVLVGLSIWTMPPWLVPSMHGPGAETVLGRCSLSLKASWLKLKYKVIEYFTYLGERYPLEMRHLIALARQEANVHLEELFNGKYPSADELSKRSYDELSKSLYPSPSASYLLLWYFCISPNYQRMGLGAALFNQSLSYIPNKRITFTSADGKSKSEGPQKLVLRASSEGVKLYTKLGLDLVHSFTAYRGDLEIPMIRMEKNR